MKIAGFVFIFILSALTDLPGQKYLIIEKSGSAHTKRISMYDNITFQLKDDDKGWFTRQIFDMNPEAQLLLLGDTWIPVSDISRIKMPYKRKLAMLLGGALQIGGISMIMGDAWYTISGKPEYSAGGWEFGLLNVAVGTGIKALLGPIKYNLGNSIRLRVIDVTFGTIKT